jgi:hypothetical protein
MAYLAGTCTSLIDLLTTIKTFCTDNGWTLDGWKDSLTGSNSDTQVAGKELHIHKGDAYFSLKTCNNIRAFYSTSTATKITGIAISGSTSYDDSKEAANWATQPGFPPYWTSGLEGYPLGCSVEVADGSYPYYLFMINDAFVCCFEYATGCYKWITFGTLTKLGTYSGGMYFATSEGGYSSYDNCFLRRISQPENSSYMYPPNSFLYLTDGPQGTKWYNNGHGNGNGTALNQSTIDLNPQGMTSDNYAPTSYNSFIFVHYLKGYNSLTARRCMSPIPFFVKDLVDSKWFTAGYIPGLRLINTQNITDGDEITLGSDVWKIFSNHRKAGASFTNVGLAVLKG